MKKIMALTLAALTALTLTFCAHAEGNQETYDKMGITITYPEEFSNTIGIFLPSPFSTEKEGVYAMLFNYYAFTKEESDAFTESTKNGGLSLEEINKIMDATGTLLMVLGIDGNRGIGELLEAMDLASQGMEEDQFIQVGQHDDITYFALTAPEAYEDFLAKVSPEYAEEFLTLQPLLIEALKNAKYFTPKSAGTDLVGTVLQFETTDIDGNAVRSEELFAEHKVTMINVWATWCGPCKSEMVELGEIGRHLVEDGKDAAIIGICQDADEEPELCKELLAEKQVDYLNLLPYEDMLEKLEIDTLPTTFFVDREGKILLPPYIGVIEDLSMYEKLIDAFLANP